MLSLPPYNSWPLHITLFHPDAVAEWNSAASKGGLNLPPGFTVSVQYEGVDGKGSRPGAARLREGPIDVKDCKFWSCYWSNFD